MSVFDLAAHKRISMWKQEAREENSALYFFPVPEAEQLRSGAASFLFDRKGKGKTAVGQSILTQPRDGHHATSLSFKNYPFNELYGSLRDSAYRAPNQYNAGWRFVILCHVARLMAKDKDIPERRRNALMSLFREDAHEAMSSRISRWLSGGFKVDILGLGGIGLEAERDFVNSNRSLAERADMLARFLAPDLARSKSRYYIVFDELDEDYTSTSSLAEREEYLALLTSLIKAVRQLRDSSEFADNVFPVVLLRDDIFKLLRDGDRTKWRDNAVALNWSEQRIKDLLAFRLSRAAGLKRVLGFDEIWRGLVGPQAKFTLRSKAWNKFDFIASYTLLRPRDFIYYLGYASKLICAKLEGDPHTPVYLNGEILRECLGPFADHLRSELEDEIGGQLPFIHDVMNIILTFDERHFRREEFRIAYEGARDKLGAHWQHSAESVLEILYSFSAIGFVRTSREYYRYQNPGVDLDTNQTMLLHKGLMAARRALR